MNNDLNQFCALVCGSTQGIGLAVAQQLAKDGFSVCLTARSEEKLQKAMASLASSAGQKHSFFVSDFTHPEGLKNAVKEHIQNYGPLHVLVNNTGGPKSGPITEADPQEFLDAFNQHLICNHILMQALLPGMKAGGYGRIVNIISTSVKQPLPNLGVSNTIRGAVANWSKTLANELGGFGITVNNVLPGATNTQRLTEIASVKANKTGESVQEILTEMGQESPMKRIAEPEEVAAAVAFLVSPKASYINGINVPVDGGRTKSL
ncbi:MAG: SDR family oxidoreductase [Flavobacteriales bacterium]